jgi:hypothetical protein
MRTPSLLARPLPEARRLLEAAGVPLVEVKHTAPPRGAPSGPMRVVRQRSASDGVYLVAAASVSLAEGEDSHD